MVGFCDWFAVRRTLIIKGGYKFFSDFVNFCDRETQILDFLLVSCSLNNLRGRVLGTELRS